MTAIVMRAVHRGIGAEQYPLGAGLFTQPYYLTPATPGRFQIEILPTAGLLHARKETLPSAV